MSLSESQLKFHLCIGVQEWEHKSLVTHKMSLSEDLPKKKKSQWMVILLINDENFCPRSLKIKQCPFLFIFLSATQIFQGILMFLYSWKQAARCSQCLGCAVHCILASHKTHASWGKQFSYLCDHNIDANFRNTVTVYKKLRP